MKKESHCTQWIFRARSRDGSTASICGGFDNNAQSPCTHAVVLVSQKTVKISNRTEAEIITVSLAAHTLSTYVTKERKRTPRLEHKKTAVVDS